MNCFKLTKRNNEYIDRITTNFLWLPNIRFNEARGFPLVAWDEVCRPKYGEGLGIRRNENVNKALITKGGESLWMMITFGSGSREINILKTTTLLEFQKMKVISLFGKKLLII